MADMGAFRVALIGAYLLMAFIYIMFLLCDVAELWTVSDTKSPERIFSYVNFAGVVSILCLIIAAFMASQIMRILFLVFNAIFVLAMAVMIGLIYADKLEQGPKSEAMKAAHLNGVCVFTYMFLAVALEIIVAFTN